MSDETEDATVFFVMLVFLAGLFLSLLISNSIGLEESIAEIYSLPFPKDTPLLTENAKAELESTGVSVFKIGQMTYVVENLPEKFIGE